MKRHLVKASELSSGHLVLNSVRAPALSFLALIIVGLIFNYTTNQFIQLTLIYAMVNMILAMSLNLVNGFTGQFSLGHAGFMAVGAYTSAFLSTTIPVFSGPLESVNFFIYAVAGGAMAAAAGYIVGLPSLRLKGDYLAIVTLGFGEIIRVVLLNIQTLGGARGMYGIPGPRDLDLGGFAISKFVQGYGAASFWLIITFFTIWRLMKSSHGRTFLSVREDEVAAEAMGINTTQAKVRAFVTSSFFAGIAGSIFAHYANYLNPSTFSFVLSVNAIIMVVLGGMGSMTGSIVAAAIVTVLPEALRPLQDFTGIDLRMVIFSFTLIMLMLLKPTGLFGELEITDIIANRWRRHVSKSA